jgi:hypothetical protein
VKLVDARVPIARDKLRRWNGIKMRLDDVESAVNTPGLSRSAKYNVGQAATEEFRI